MANYTMAQVEILTGIRPHTLRKWEDRYHFLKPKRTKTNIRYYDDDMVRRLLNTAILSRNNFAISKIDRMKECEINEKIEELTQDNPSNFDDVVMSIITSPRLNSIGDEVSTILSENNCTFLLSGISPEIARIQNDKRVSILSGPDDYIKFLSQYGMNIDILH